MEKDITKYKSRKWIQSIINYILGTGMTVFLMITFKDMDQSSQMMWLYLSYMGFLGLNSGIYNLFNHLDKLCRMKKD